MGISRKLVAAASGNCCYCFGRVKDHVIPVVLRKQEDMRVDKNIILWLLSVAGFHYKHYVEVFIFSWTVIHMICVAVFIELFDTFLQSLWFH